MESFTPGLATTGRRQIGASLGLKLAAGFALLTLMSVALGLFAFERMSVMNTATVSIRDDYLPSTRESARLALAVDAMRRAEGRYAACVTEVECQEVLVKEQKTLTEVDAARHDYENHIDRGQERNGYTTIFDRIWSAFKAQDAQLIRFKKAGSDEVAQTFFNTASVANFEALTNFMTWDMDYNQKEAQQAATVSRHVYATTWKLLLAGLAMVLALGALIAIAFARHISHPLAAMADAMRRLAGGDMSASIPCVGRRDEIGRMAASVQVFKDNMMTAARLSAEQASEQEVRQRRSARIESLVGDFERQIGSTVTILASASTDMQATAVSMTSNAADTNRQATAVAHAAADSSSGVQTVAAASEQLSSSILEINRQVSSSATLTGRAVGSVRRTDTTVRALSESAARIGQVVELITSIASQTNLLALNATIEAARAGDAGKGFAVVASEVKNLAQQTAHATNEISAQIGQVQQATGGAVDAIKEIGSIIEEVGAITTSIAAAVEQQGAATAEIARNVQQTAVSTRTVTANISGVSRAANDTGVAAGQVLGAAGDLSRQAEHLSMEVNSFIASVRSA